MESKSKIVNKLKLITRDKHVITSKWGKEPLVKVGDMEREKH